MVKTGQKISYSIPQNATKFYWTDDVSTIPVTVVVTLSIKYSNGFDEELLSIRRRGT